MNFSLNSVFSKYTANSDFPTSLKLCPFSTTSAIHLFKNSTWLCRRTGKKQVPSCSCLDNAIVLEAQWIPRSLNDRAGMLSRFIDPDERSLHPSVFCLLDARWEPHTIDSFASPYNAQLPLFNSRYASPGSCSVDAFTEDWSRGDSDNWLCPPVNVVVQYVRHLEACRGCELSPGLYANWVGLRHSSTAPLTCI